MNSNGDEGLGDEFREDHIAGYYEEETYSKALNREDTLERQMRMVTFFYSRGLWDEFEYSIKALISLLPKIVRTAFTPLEHNTSREGVEAHYNQFTDIQEKLESDTNMIFKKRFIKTFE